VAGVTAKTGDGTEQGSRVERILGRAPVLDGCCAPGRVPEGPALAEPQEDIVAVDPAAYVTRNEDGAALLHLVVENLHCPSCVHDIESALHARDGVISARVNLTTHRVTVCWDADRLDAAEIPRLLADRGYRVVPYDPDQLAQLSDGEDKVLLRALAVAGFAAANVMLLSVSVWSGLGSDMGVATRDFFHWVSALIALPAIAYSGRPFYRSALTALRNRGLNMDVPISLAVLLAAGLSLYRTAAGEDHVYFDASVMLLFFLLVGRFLDRRTRARARDAAQNLLALRVAAATVVADDGSRRSIPISAVRPGMTVAVASGERIPVDGTLISGVTEVDSSLVTGESLPRTLRDGDRVFAGTLNLGPAVEVGVTASDDETLLAEIVRLMEAAEQGRARYIRLADRAARIYAPAVHLLAAVTFLGWYLLGPVGWEMALMNAVAVLIITCPCALGLAVPAVQVVAVGRLLTKGVLVKVADGLERLAEVDWVVFDKTGTLTTGALALTNAGDVSAEDLRLAASLAQSSRHPLSRALVYACDDVPGLPDVREVPGQGLVARCEEGEVRLGNRVWCGAEGIDSDPAGPFDGGSELWLSRPGVAPVRFCFTDSLRDDVREVISALKEKGLQLELLSGDRQSAVESLAGTVGIERWKAECLPQDKIARLEELREQGHRVLMVGDGLNDAPALAAAHASLSPSTAADVSQTSADFIFQGRSLGPVLEAFRVSKISRRLVLQNFGLALFYNVLAVPLAMAGLVTPLIAAVAMSASSIVVTVNALRLRWTGNETAAARASQQARGENHWTSSYT